METSNMAGYWIIWSGFDTSLYLLVSCHWI